MQLALAVLFVMGAGWPSLLVCLMFAYEYVSLHAVILCSRACFGFYCTVILLGLLGMHLHAGHNPAVDVFDDDGALFDEVFNFGSELPMPPEEKPIAESFSNGRSRRPPSVLEAAAAQQRPMAPRDIKPPPTGPDDDEEWSKLFKYVQSV
jgi:hypothetical protein